MQKWTETHGTLQDLLKKEIETMRRLLENMHQEEMIILRKEIHYLTQVMDERTTLVSQLTDLRQKRIVATTLLQELAQNSAHDAPLEQLVPIDNENSWYLLSLRDQVVALLDRMNLQSSRNQMLTHLSAHQPEPQKKPKVSIATLESPE